MSEKTETKCNCPDPGPHRECHCRAKRYNAHFASDDWCGCKCHHPAPARTTEPVS